MKKPTTSSLQKKIWIECKRLTRSKYGNTCYTCGKGGLEGSNWHTGHLFPKGTLSAYLKYDLRVLRPQCYNCNINLGGNGAMYIELMRSREGDEYVDKIIEDKDKKKNIQAYDHYLVILDQYRSM